MENQWKFVVRETLENSGQWSEEKYGVLSTKYKDEAL
jgi:hypothetical protein